MVRTKDRPSLLREALGSIAATGYPCEVVVVNDGGRTSDADAAASSVSGEGLALRVVHHQTSRGRSAAANAGVAAATRSFLAFLDDDDLFYPEHLATLTRAAGSAHAGWYSDAVSAFLRPGQGGAYETGKRLRLFAQDYDRDLLLLDNYIPLPTLLVPRESYLDAGGFDPAFDLFEDWDFLIRLSRRGSLLRIPRVTCEIRHFEGGNSIVLAAPEGSPRFRAAKLAVWKKHDAEIGHEVIAGAFERQKQRLNRLAALSTESEGSVSAALRDVARLERDKQELIAHGAEIRNEANGHMFRVRELEGAVRVLGEANEKNGASLVVAEKEAARLAAELALTKAELALTKSEVERLGSLLNMIFRSKTWKMHVFLDRLRGRG